MNHWFRMPSAESYVPRGGHIRPRVSDHWSGELAFAQASIAFTISRSCRTRCPRYRTTSTNMPAISGRRRWRGRWHIASARSDDHRHAWRLRDFHFHRAGCRFVRHDRQQLSCGNSAGLINRMTSPGSLYLEEGRSPFGLPIVIASYCLEPRAYTSRYAPQDGQAPGS